MGDHVRPGRRRPRTRRVQARAPPAPRRACPLRLGVPPMARDPVAPLAPGAGAPRAWPLVLGGLATTVAALVLYGLSGLDSLAGLRNALLARIPLAAAGLIAAGVGIARRLRAAAPEFEDRVESAGMMVVAAF